MFYYGLRKYQNHFGLLLAFPLGLHFFLNIFGVMSLYLGSGETSVNINVDRETINQVTLEFFIAYFLISAAFLILMNVLGKTTFHIDISNYFGSKYSALVNFRLISISIFLLFFDAFYYGVPPGLYAITGDVVGAATQKGHILEAKINGSIPMLGYYIRYVPLISFVHATLFYVNNEKALNSAYLLLGIFIIYSLLTLLKSYFFVPLLLFVWTLFIIGKLKVVHFVTFPIVVLFVLYATFSGLNANSSEILFKIYERLFLVQAEGMYIIRDFYGDFDVGALLYSSPLRHIFDVQTFDPAASVVNHYFGNASGWVNMNSFYSGQAYLMFGYLYLILIPIIFLCQFLISRYLLRGFLPRGLVNVVLISITLLLPLSNNIANLVWFKDLLSVILILPFLWLIVNTKKIL
jgi:hypothetical protein